MPDEYESFVSDARTFLCALSDNNTRDWFADNKARYEAQLKTPAEHLLTAMEAKLEQISGAPVESKLFRSHRDVRFSKDKTPYHTHLHMLWTTPEDAGWFFGIAPEYVSAGAGVMRLEKERLSRYRAAVDSVAGEELAAIIDAVGGRMDPPQLKRVPPPYDKSHPREALLRCKSLALWRDGLEDRFSGNLTEDLAKIFAELAPLVTWLRTHV